jgi:hypothetical protein
MDSLSLNRWQNSLQCKRRRQFCGQFVSDADDAASKTICLISLVDYTVSWTQNTSFCSKRIHANLVQNIPGKRSCCQSFPASSNIRLCGHYCCVVQGNLQAPIGHNVFHVANQSMKRTATQCSGHKTLMSSELHSSVITIYGVILNSNMASPLWCNVT